jgi:type III secretory pathway component EscU
MFLSVLAMYVIYTIADAYVQQRRHKKLIKEAKDKLKNDTDENE